MDGTMTCPNCGGNPEMTENHGGTDMGDRFTEVYECPRCPVRGKITGEVGDPRGWRKTGRLFRGDA